MTLLGGHFSISRGLDSALYEAKAYGCTTCQIFTKNAATWRERQLTPDRINAFGKARTDTGIDRIASHASYLINLASPDESKHARSIHALENELIRAGMLDIPYVVLHPGAHMGEGEETGVQRIIDCLNRIFRKTADVAPTLLLETTSGQGSGIGHRFEQLAGILSGVDEQRRIGICMDSCHIFAAGYDIRTEAAYGSMMHRFDTVIGLDRLHLIHLNDSKKPFASRIDRHSHIGKGQIGLAGFRCFMTDSRLAEVPKIIETPKEQGLDWDRVNLDLLRRLADKN